MKLEDVLHFYIGQKARIEFVVEKAKQFLAKEGSVVTIDPITIQLCLEESLKISPILRPLSSMTEGEHKHAKSINIMDAWVRDAERTRYLCSIGIDLFNLIDNNLAIDSSTLNP